jgi:hypothetical protein
MRDKAGEIEQAKGKRALRWWMGRTKQQGACRFGDRVQERFSTTKRSQYRNNA